MKSYRKLMMAALIAVSSIWTVSAESLAVKTNLLGWAAVGTANVGAELAVARRSSVQLFGALNPWTLSGDKRMRFWSLQPEYRYWFCNTFNGHFVGVHALGGEYNIKNIKLPLGLLPDQGKKGRHYEGWYAGAGLTYGYQWMVARNWNIEASIGVGYAYSPYKLYGTCDRVLKSETKHYFGPTKLALSIMYVF